MSDAIWRAIPGYEGRYEVSSGGQVRSIRHMTSCGPRGGVTLRSTLSAGYPKVNLFDAESKRTWRIHNLVMLAFAGPRPDGYETRHLDGDRTNPALSNLAYGTVSQNRFDAVRHGTHVHTRRTHCSNGHELTPDNTYVQRDRRRCRTCVHDQYVARRDASTKQERSPRSTGS